MALFKRRKKEEKEEADKKSEASGGTAAKSMKDLYQEETKKAQPKTKAKKETAVKKPKSSQDAKTTTSKGEVSSRKVNRHGKAYKTLVRPIITEKSGDLGVQNKYIFEVATSSNRVEVAQAIEEVYGVKPAKVNIIKVKGKQVRFGRIPGKRKDWKKAVVTLPKEKTINVYEGV